VRTAAPDAMVSISRIGPLSVKSMRTANGTHPCHPCL
jgi:hypothetical protein